MDSTVLLLIDFQKGLNDPSFGQPRSNPNIAINASTLLKSFRSATIPVIHVRHHSINPSAPLHPSQPGASFEEYATPLPGEKIFTKHVNSAFIGTDLEQHLRAHNVTRLVICGITTDHCVSTTTRMAANLKVVGEEGEILLVGDATAAHPKGGYDAELVQAVNLVSLNDEFCRVVSTEQVLAEMETWIG